MGAEAKLWAVAAGACALLAACEPAGRDLDAAARAVVAACREDAACVRERWAGGPDRSLGLRSDVAGQSARDLYVVETTREVGSPDSGSPACAPGGAIVYFRTTLAAKDSPAPPLGIFRWATLEEALAGHRRVAAIGVEARGDAAVLQSRVEAAADLDRACAWIRDRRDRCRD